MTDEGRGFDVAAVLQRLGPTEETLLMPSGRGILLMKAFLDGVRFEADGRRVVLTMNRTGGPEQRQHEPPRDDERRAHAAASATRSASP